MSRDREKSRFVLETDSSLNILDGPGINSWDLAVLKDFKLTERLGLQFRSALYN
jgi:hypothetical protein